MAAIKTLPASEDVRFELVAIPQKEKGTGLDEDKALVLARMNCTGVDWEGGMRLSGWNRGLRGSMEANVIEIEDAEMVAAGFEGAKQVLAVRESVWSKDGDKAWQGVKQDKCMVNLSPNKYRVKEKDHEGWWVANSKNQPLPFTETNYALFLKAVEDQLTNDVAKVDKPGGLLTLKPFKANHAKLHDYVGKHVRWELRESANA